MRTIITGGTGLVGRALAQRLSEPVVLSRTRRSRMEGIPQASISQWQPMLAPPAREVLDGAEAIIQLAGESVASGRWSADKKRRIMRSRSVGTRNLVDAIAGLERKPRVLVSASAVGFYGDRKDEILTEESRHGSGFLADVCRAWEAEARRATEFGVKVVCVRIGIVLTRRGGALERMTAPFKMGAGGRIGDGKQYMPWIHLEDLSRLLVHVAERPGAETLNGVAPNPVTNATFTRALSQSVKRPALLPVPSALLRLAIGDMSQILLGSQRAVPRAALDSGFTFQFDTLEQALEREFPSQSSRRSA